MLFQDGRRSVAHLNLWTLENSGEAGSAYECQPKLEDEIQPCESQPKYFDKFLGRKACHETNVGRSKSWLKQTRPKIYLDKRMLAEH